MKGFIVQPEYVNIDNGTYVQLFGRLENGESFVSVHKFEPYFFVLKSDQKKVKKLLKDVKMVEAKEKTFSGEEVLKLFFDNQTDLNNYRHSLHEEEILTFEADLKPQYRFLIDRKIKGSLEIEGDYESSEKVERVYQEAEIKPADFKPELKVASVDIETSSDGKLYCIGIVSKDYEKNFIVSKEKLKRAVSCKDEEDCLQKFRDEIIELDPDVITGWNVVDFDFNYLKKKFEENKINFDLGRTNEKVRIRIEKNFFRSSSMQVPGRVVLDGLNLIKDPYIKESPTIKEKKFDSYKLEDVASEMLGKGKLLKGSGRHVQIEEYYEKNQEKLVDYNLVDCELVYEIIENAQLIDLAVERSQLTGMPIDRVTASIASFDFVYISRARELGLVSPTANFVKKVERIKGGFVMSPEPGVYHNVLVLDFKSLYPSIIRTFNIDPSSFLLKAEKNCIKSPNGACFKNTDGILPEIIEELHRAREKAKKEKREFSSYAIKIIMNSFFGVLASPNCRYFNMDRANAITNFGQAIIKLTKEKIEGIGYKVIYGDTDSVCVYAGDKGAEKIGTEIQDSINEFYDNYVKENFNRKSFLELEFEKMYLSLLMPKTRGSSAGAKKRYAGLIKKNNKEVLEITGLEAIRGDWTEAAQDFQKDLLLKIFHKEDPKAFVKKFVADLLKGKIDEKLVYRKSIRKDLAEYTKMTPPHVKAARKMTALEGNRIEYYLTTDGPEPLSNLQHKIDYGHYVEKQIKPIAQSILDLLGLKFEEIVSGERQGKLF
ncbi:DNA polymerase II [archaeon]|nr:DNA polymerase II [archaeon]